MYIHDLKDWPKFEWNQEVVLDLLVPLRHQQGLLAVLCGAHKSIVEHAGTLRQIPSNVLGLVAHT